MRIFQPAVAVAIGVLLLATQCSPANSQTASSALAGAFQLPMSNIIIGASVMAMKLSIAGRLLGIISDWFVNRGPEGVTVTKEFVSVPPDHASEDDMARSDSQRHADSRSSFGQDSRSVDRQQELAYLRERVRRLHAMMQQKPPMRQDHPYQVYPQMQGQPDQYGHQPRIQQRHGLFPPNRTYPQAWDFQQNGYRPSTGSAYGANRASWPPTGARMTVAQNPQHAVYNVQNPQSSQHLISAQRQPQYSMHQQYTSQHEQEPPSQHPVQQQVTQQPAQPQLTQYIAQQQLAQHPAQFQPPQHLAQFQPPQHPAQFQPPQHPAQFQPPQHPAQFQPPQHPAQFQPPQHPAQHQLPQHPAQYQAAQQPATHQQLLTQIAQLLQQYMKPAVTPNHKKTVAEQAQQSAQHLRETSTSRVAPHTSDTSPDTVEPASASHSEPMAPNAVNTNAGNSSDNSTASTSANSNTTTDASDDSGALQARAPRSRRYRHHIDKRAAVTDEHPETTALGTPRPEGQVKPVIQFRLDELDPVTRLDIGHTSSALLTEVDSSDGTSSPEDAQGTEATATPEVVHSTGTPSEDDEVPTPDPKLGLSDAEISQIKEYTSELRTHDRRRCALKMVCYMGADEARGTGYGQALSAFFNTLWSQYRPRIIDRMFGYDDAFRHGRTHGHEGCILKYNSCPMNIVNTLLLATNLQRTPDSAANRSIDAEQAEAKSTIPASA